MKFNKEYFSIAIAYLIVVLYVIIDNNPLVTSFLVVSLLLYHWVVYSQLTQKLSSDKEISVSKLQHRLAKTKKEQQESYKRFTLLSQSFGSGLLMIDEEGIIKVANKDIKKYFNRDFSNLDYQKITDLKGLYNFVNQAYLLETSIRNQIEYNNHFYDLISTPLLKDKEFKGALILVHDITLIKNAEKYQKQFTADVSHELRTPLSAIKGFSEILSRDENISEKERREFIELIKKESGRMEVILNDLLIISKMDRLDYELNLISADITLVIEECISILKKQIKDKGLKYSIETESAILEIDKIRMIQVLLNILKNAINYTDKGSIDIKGFYKDNEYIITITDSGIGIKEENYEKIFKRFYRIDKVRSRDSGGSGLGLSISKNVILKHRGKIQVSSKINEGTTFTIRLPRKK